METGYSIKGERVCKVVKGSVNLCVKRVVWGAHGLKVVSCKEI